MAAPTVTLFCRIPPELAERLEKYCTETNKSKNQAVTEALEKMLAEQE
jgi:predicted DNA-binding protein